MPFKRAAAIDLAGRDILAAVKMSVIPKVIETPRIAAVAKDGIQTEDDVPSDPLLSFIVLAAARERPARRLNLADPRKGIVLATILGPCGAQSPDQDHRP
jgi:hypothetical protein